jgi:phospholipid/cholesterol/gamma-HCH transport system ATP-binding protein
MGLKSIEMKAGSFYFEKNHPIFSNLDLMVRCGESIVVIGPSGHGKSTLVKILSGLIPLNSGEIHLLGTSLNSLKEKAKKKLLKRVGILFQKNALFDSLSCFENVAFPLRETTRLSNNEIKEKVMFFLKAVEIEHATQLYPSEISGGMQKRLGIARAMALNPELTFYDDPTAGLDPITSRIIVDLIKYVKTDEKTIVTVTNDMNRAYQLADRIFFVYEGEVIDTGSVEQTKNHKDPRILQFIKGYTEGPLTRGEDG